MKGESSVISVLILGVSSASIGCFQELKIFVQEFFTVLSFHPPTPLYIFSQLDNNFLTYCYVTDAQIPVTRSPWKVIFF